MTGCLSQCLTFGDHFSPLNPKAPTFVEPMPKGNLFRMPHSINQMTVIKPVSVRKIAILDTSIGKGSGKGESGIRRKTNGTERIVRSHPNSRPRLSHNTVTEVSPATTSGNLMLFNPASHSVQAWRHGQLG